MTQTSTRKHVLFALLTLYATALLTSMAGMEIFGWALAAASLFFIVTTRSFKDLRLGIELPLAGFVLAALISDLRNGYDLTHILVTLGEFRWIILLYAITWALQQTNFAFEQKKVAYWFLLIFAVTAVIMWMQFVSGVDLLRPGVHLDPTSGNHWRAQGFFNICITTAYALGVQVLFYFGRGLVTRAEKSSDKLGWVYVACFVLGSIGVYLSFTRGAWLAWIVTIPLCALLWRPRVKTLLSLVLFLVVVAAIFRVAGGREVAERVSTISNTETDQSNSQRIVLWKANIEIVETHPLFGVGWNQNSKFIPEAYKEIGHSEATFVSHSHNNLLQTLGGVGIVGFVFYAWLCLLMMWKALRLVLKTPVRGFALATDVRAVALGSLAAQIFFHIGGLTQCNFIDAEVAHNLFFVWAMTLVAERAR